MCIQASAALHLSLYLAQTHPKMENICLVYTAQEKVVVRVCAFVQAAVTCCMLLLDGLDHLQVALDGGGYSCHELAICTSPASCAVVLFVLYEIHFTNVHTYKIANVVICDVSVCVCVCVHICIYKINAFSC